MSIFFKKKRTKELLLLDKSNSLILPLLCGPIVIIFFVAR